MSTTGSPLEPILARQGVVILDGGLATELEGRGHDLSDNLWSARLLLDEPDEICSVHADYLDAGADCIVAASYQATVAGFRRSGVAEDEARDLIRGAVRLALKVRGTRSALVAASVGPYGAALADGSEYTGDYDLDEAGLHTWHAERFRLLATSGADLLACETLPSYAEAVALAKLVDETPEVWAWFSFSCRDGTHISDGTLLRDCVARLEEYPRIAAVGINCTAPRHVASLIAEVRCATEKPIVCYPNSGERWDASRRRWVGTRDSREFADASVEWRRAGASLIGGCCRTGPAHVRALRARILAVRPGG